MIRYFLFFFSAILVPFAGTQAEPAGAVTRGEPHPFSEEIYLFGVEDEVNPPRGCETLFVGSSSFRFWFTLHRDYPGRHILKRGFGGARISDINFYFDRIVARYRPAQIIFYAGENDLSAGGSVEQVLADFNEFMLLKRRSFNEVPVHFVSVKPSVARAAERAKQEDLNRRIAAIAKVSGDDLTYIDVATPMLRAGSPRPDLFISDGLHMNAAGYAIWQKRINAALRTAGNACVVRSQASDANR